MTFDAPHSGRTGSPFSEKPADAQESVRLQETFLRNLSHELRTPLNGLLSAGELLAMNTEDTQLVSLFNQSGKRLMALVEDIETLSRLYSHPPEIKPIRVSVILGMIPLETHPGPLPPGTCVPGDKHLLQQAMMTFNRLADCFQQPSPHGEMRAPPTAVLKTDHIAIRYPLCLFGLNDRNLDSFFHIESCARCTSAAEPLGLAPAVASMIIESFGGSISLRRINPKFGLLHLSLPLVSCA